MILALSACSRNTDTGTRTPPSGLYVPPPPDDESVGCDKVIDLAQICYDASNPGVSCVDVGQAMGAAGIIAADMPASVASRLASLCMAVCDARQNGILWSDVRAELDYSCRR